jgi:glyoxylase-like metal-dependent hydrolase (beta-lactamase superfamily II)
VLAPGGAVLVDAVFADQLPAIQAVAAAGHPPTALVLTHRHVVPQGDALGAVARAFGVPVLLHPIDAAHPQARVSPVPLGDPTTSAALRAAGVEALLFPGHTAGHVVLYGAAGGGFVVAGDCAMGPTAGEAAAGADVLVRAPLAFNVDDGALRRGWLAFDRPLATIGPLHGEPLAGRPASVPRALAALRAEAPTTTLGVDWGGRGGSGERSAQ